MHKKIFFVIFILMFIITTCMAYLTDNTLKKVVIRSQSFKLIQDQSNFIKSQSQVTVNNSNTQTITTNKKILETTQSNQQTTKSLGSSSVSREQSSYQINEVQKQKNNFYYEDISWNEWKSNLINQFLRDSSQISALDNYGLGTWFYYAFDVTDKGEVKNIRIFSFYLKAKDKAEIRDLIYHYAFKDIVKFPNNSKRKKVKIDAIVMLSNSFVKSEPSDFNDHEKIKIEY